MLRTRSRISSTAALGLGVALAIGGGLASASAAEPDSVESWIVPQTQQGGGFWTSEKMEAAVPADVLVAGKTAKTPTAAVEKGAEIVIPRQVASTKAGASTDTDPSTNANPEAPVSHIGKVFFSSGGGNYVCSGNAVSSGNESTVSTAGHCVNEGGGAFVTNFVFVPAYDNGAAPYGQWPAIELVAPTEWTSGGDLSYDTGFAVVSTVNNASLTDTVGGSGLTFNDARGLGYAAYGYPAAAPFNGQTLQSCAGTATADPFGQSQSQGIPCDMTGGSSGGPWFIGSGTGGSQNSVNSFGYTSVSNTMFGPYWGSVIGAAYDSAAN
ncbi:hypothetical protein EYE40_05245 [Glaciihabitans arcticus]|uniref:V8-like Glu-specific endopeptidase n=1 Tax=Glaciihabitans arcticus TaxID=2668039 RepID=A0A4Q9GPS6_9MICO|nr:hypothetical protein [Glaciihabitans arcticus]TBN56852.1 hypothetical protein EYE40_05245 [Glaciihabitans arcticus]